MRRLAMLVAMTTVTPVAMTTIASVATMRMTRAVADAVSCAQLRDLRLLRPVSMPRLRRGGQDARCEEQG